MFPKLNIKKIKTIELDNYTFMPLWQSNDYYYLENEKITKLKKFSFAHAITKNISQNVDYIYYIPISFIIGFVGSIVGFFIIMLLLITFVIKIIKKNEQFFYLRFFNKRK